MLLKWTVAIASLAGFMVYPIEAVRFKVLSMEMRGPISTVGKHDISENRVTSSPEEPSFNVIRFRVKMKKSFWYRHDLSDITVLAMKAYYDKPSPTEFPLQLDSTSCPVFFISEPRMYEAHCEIKVRRADTFNLGLWPVPWNKAPLHLKIYIRGELNQWHAFSNAVVLYPTIAEMEGIEQRFPEIWTYMRDLSTPMIPFEEIPDKFSHLKKPYPHIFNLPPRYPYPEEAYAHYRHRDIPIPMLPDLRALTDRARYNRRDWEDSRH